MLLMVKNMASLYYNYRYPPARHLGSRIPGLIFYRNFFLDVLSFFWAAAPKGRCPVGHRGEFPDVRPYIRMYVRTSVPPCQSF